MEICHNPAHTGPCVLVLGMFDGVHLGHQALLEAGKRLAKESGLPLHVFTFEPHPLQVLAPDHAPPMLTTLAERAGRMAQLGADMLCVCSFDRQVASMPPEAFLEHVDRVFQPGALVCGFNFTFGDHGRGSGETLRHWGQARAIPVEVVPDVKVLGESVSSTRIRSLLSAGRLEEANALLGCPYRISGRVVGGKHIGRKLGFPTANLQPPPEKAIPAYGVYCCWLTAGAQRYPALVNIGLHPTLPEGGPTIEAYALDQQLALYDREVAVDLLRYLRPEARFPDVSALERQQALDAAQARAWFANR